MATVCDHLSVEELEERYVGCEDATASRHFQVIWLLARGHTISQVAVTTAFGERWIEQLLARYNAAGPEALGDLRRRNGASATILKPELLAKLRDRLCEPPADGGLWSSRKVADWMAAELGLTSVAPQRGWEALKAIGWSIQKPRPKNPKSATPEEAAAFKKRSRTPLPKRRRSILANQSRFSRQTSTALARSRSRAACGRQSASVQSRLAITGSIGSLSRRSSHRPLARPSGMFPMACRRNFSPLCLKPSRGKPKRA